MLIKVSFWRSRETVTGMKRKSMTYSLATCMGLSLLSMASANATEAWTEFRNGGNTSIEAQGLPVTWSPDEGIAWKIELPGYGQSSPVIWKDVVYLTSIQGDDKEQCFLVAIEMASGDVLWQREYPATVRLKNAEMVSRAAPTPVIDANGIYVLFESGDLHAISHDGSSQWLKSLFEDAGSYKNNHGYAASLTQMDHAVIVLVDHTGPSYLLALNKQTGEEVWKTERTSRTSWSSPCVTQFGDQVQVIVSSGGTVDGYDARTGNQLWSCSGLNGNTIPSATPVGDLIFVGASQARGGASEAAAASNCCVKITPGGDAPYQVVWKAEKALCSYVSPLAHRGYVYYVNSVGVLYCLEAATGRQCYAERIDGACWAQPVAVGDLIYFFTKKGVTSVVKAGSEFEQVASNRLWTEEAPPRRAVEEAAPGGEGGAEAQPRSREQMDPIIYAVAAVDRAFVIRLGTHLYRVGTNVAVAAGETGLK